jgi:prephenate dehydrogenase
VMKQAQALGAVDETKRQASAVAGVADILLLCEPLDQMEGLIKTIAPEVKPHTVVLDTAVLKQPVARWVKSYFKQGHYVSCAPIMAADKLYDTRRGIEAADGDLFRNSTFCLFPGPDVPDTAVQTAATIGQLIGGQPFFVDIMEYDVYQQALETLPSLASLALFRTLTQRTGWQDMSRFAGLSFAQFTSLMSRETELTPLVLADKHSLIHWLDSYVAELLELRRWVQEGEPDTLNALMREFGVQREEWLHLRQENDWSSPEDNVQKRGLMSQMFGTLLDRGDGTEKKRGG